MNLKSVFSAALTTLAMGTIGASQVPAQQPSLLNPLTWFNSPNYSSGCANGQCSQSLYRPAAYQTNYAPAVANTYYYPTTGSSLSPVGTSSCPGGVCPTGACANGSCGVNCVNGQCFTGNCANGQCFPPGANYGAGYAPNNSFYAPAANLPSPYYTSQVSAPINYSNSSYPTAPYAGSSIYTPPQTPWAVPQNSLPYTNQYGSQYAPGQYGGGLR